MLDSFRFDEQKKLLSNRFSSNYANIDYEFRFNKTAVKNLTKELEKFNYRYDSYLLPEEKQACNI